MSDFKNIASQSSVFLLGTVFTVVVGFFFKIFLAKQLGAEGLGIYSLGISIISVFSVFVSLGLGNGLVKYVSKYTAEKNYTQLQTYLHSTFKYSFIATVLFGILLLIFPNFIGDKLLSSPEITSYLPYFAILLFVNTGISLFDQTIRGFKQVKKSTIFGNFIRQPLKIILAIVFVSLGFNLVGYLYAEIFAAIITLYFFYKITKKHLPIGTGCIINKPLTKINKEERNFGINFMIIGVVGIINSEADKILLAKYFTFEELGIYSIILTLTAFVPIVLNSVIAIFGPIISEKFAITAVEEIIVLVKKTSYYIFLISFSIVLIIAFGGKVLLGLFGSEYVMGYDSMIVILIGGVFNMMTGAVGTVLVMSGNEKKVRNIQIISFVISLPLFIVLIPLLGILGAAIVKMIVLIITNAYLTYLMYKKSNIFIFNERYLKLIIFSFVFVILSVLLREFFELYSTLKIFLILSGLIFIFYLSWYLFLSDKSEQKLIANFVKSKLKRNER